MALSKVSLTRYLTRLRICDGYIRPFHTSTLFYTDKKEKPPQLEAKIDDFKEDILVEPRHKIKQLIRDYGASAFVVHTVVSLISLGSCYFLISSGVPMETLIAKFASSETAKYLNAGSTFAVAYICHKALMPFRIGITVSLTPALVTYLRARGILKLPPSLKQSSGSPISK